MRRCPVIACLSLIALPAAARQPPPGDPRTGRAIAQRACRQCHMIGESESQAAVSTALRR